MAEEYDEDRLEQLNEYPGIGDYALVSEDTQGFAGETWWSISSLSSLSLTGP
ncbi:MAG: hypothetical protein WBW55_05650 [Desulfobaccales bacterium]